MHYVMLSAEELYPMVKLVTPMDNALWVEGERFKDPVPPLEFEIAPKGDMVWVDYISPAAGIPLFSPALRKTLEKCGVDNIDYYPAVIRDLRKKEVREYYAANVIGLMSGVDRKRSEFTPFEEGSLQILGFTRLALKEGTITGHRLFRLAEFSLLLIADEIVKQTLEQTKLVGVLFVEPEKWDGFAT